MGKSGILNVIRRIVSAITLLTGVYIFMTASDIGEIFAMFRVPAGRASQIAILIGIGVIVASIVELFAAPYAGANYFVAAAYIVLALCCMVYYKHYSIFKDIVILGMVLAVSALVIFAPTWLTAKL